MAKGKATATTSSSLDVNVKDNDTINILVIKTGGDTTTTTIEWSNSIGHYENNEITINDEFMNEMYKQSGNKSAKLYTKSIDSVETGFDVLHIFDENSFPNSHKTKSGFTDNDMIIVFGKHDGKAGTENKYDFPPPIDNDIFYGNLCLVKVHIDSNNINLVDLDKSSWNVIYEYLFGGFDDCDADNDEDEDEDEDQDEYAELSKTRNGYAKDGFVVEDDTDGDSSYCSDEEFYLSDED